ncbi:ABC transporter permease subunit [Pelistega sp. NLN82]|uniref:ABC transporter permease subunit n=1 Tax=Pelistega ratti TaxID=2652177 RepID=A0A6L9Y6R7_9BURK|nr:ABC transporter permease subunit [Pelistega ratti]NEN76043.1 ABC transporter permease subunit [Pelistega ratti]
MSESLDLFWIALQDCIAALPVTLFLTVVSVSIGLLLAIPCAVMVQKKNTIRAKLINGFVYFFTGTPLLIQLYIFYYGIPSLSVVNELMHQPAFSFLKGSYIYVLAALALNTAAYSTVIFSGAIRNTDRGEIEAAYAYGMSRAQAMRRVILPSSLRRALPAYSNEVIMTMHATALASTVTIMEITGAASFFNSTYYEPFIAYAAAAVLYFVLNGLLVLGFRQIEKRYLVHLKSRLVSA